ncbi:MAG: response regulator [candidate division KSB1 bacterium]|nr:response regulator [candidate division KSB1 bacterium]
MTGVEEETRTLLLVDPHAENVRILREHLTGLGYQVFTCGSAGEALTKVAEVKPDLVLSEFVLPDGDGAELLDRIESDPRTARTPVVFLSKSGEPETRVRALSLGAKDFLAKPMHVKEVVARLEMVLARLRRRQQSTPAQKGPSGHLEEVPLLDLLLQMAQEAKSAVIRLTTPSGRSGQVIVRSGAVVHAATTSNKRESAFFEMLAWRRGRFTVAYEETETPDGMPLSPLGLLLEGARRLEEIQALERQLPGLEAVMVPTENFRQILSRREPSPELHKFIALFDGQRTLETILDESGYDLATALHRVVKLYRQGFLRRVDQPEREEEEEGEAFGPEALREPHLVSILKADIEEQTTAATEAHPKSVVAPARESASESAPTVAVPAVPPLDRTGPPRPRRGIIFIGSARAGRRKIISTLTGGNFRVRTLRNFGDVSLDRGSAVLSNGLRLEVFGLEPDPRFGALSKIVAFELSGCVIVIDGSRAEAYDYYAYLISSLRQALPALPSIVAATNVGEGSIAPEVLRKRLGLPPSDLVALCDPGDRESVEHLVEQLLSGEGSLPHPQTVLAGEPVTKD